MSDPELAERLRRAVERLEILRSQSRGMLEPARLGGKIEGVKLAASYLEEGERIFGPYIDTDVLAPVVAAIRAEAWDEGYRSGSSNAMRRMSDEPNAPTTPNPYRNTEVQP